MMLPLSISAMFLLCFYYVLCLFCYASAFSQMISMQGVPYKMLKMSTYSRSMTSPNKL